MYEFCNTSIAVYMRKFIKDIVNKKVNNMAATKVYGIGMSDAQAQREFRALERYWKSPEYRERSEQYDRKMAAQLPELAIRGMKVIEATPEKLKFWKTWIEVNSERPIAYNVATVQTTVELLEELAKGKPVTKKIFDVISEPGITTMMAGMAASNAAYLSARGEELKKAFAKYEGIPLERLESFGKLARD